METKNKFYELSSFEKWVTIADGARKQYSRFVHKGRLDQE